MSTLRVPQGDLAREYAELKAELDSAVAGVLARGLFLLGPETEAFESEFASWLGRRFVVSCASGTEAITLALMVLGVGGGDEVLIPANTCEPTATGVRLAGARPVPVDVDPETLQIDAASLRVRRTLRAKAVVPVHLYGNPVDMDAVGALGLPVIEDCAQAQGALYRGRKAGTFGILSCFSFYPSKNLGAYGDAGAVATDDPALAMRLRRLRNYGQSRRDLHEEAGLNSRMDELQAAVLRVKLRRLDEWNLRRERAAVLLDRALDGAAGLRRPRLVDGGRSAHHLYPVLCDRRDRLAAHLEAAGVQTRIHYPIPLHLQPCHADWGLREGDLPHAEAAARSVLSLPLFPHLSDSEVDAVSAAVRSFR